MQPKSKSLERNLWNWKLIEFACIWGCIHRSLSRSCCGSVVCTTHSSVPKPLGDFAVTAVVKLSHFIDCKVLLQRFYLTFYDGKLEFTRTLGRALFHRIKDAVLRFKHSAASPFQIRIGGWYFCFFKERLNNVTAAVPRSWPWWLSVRHKTLDFQITSQRRTALIPEYIRVIHSIMRVQTLRFKRHRHTTPNLTSND